MSVVALLAVTAPPVAASGGTTERVSVSSTGQQGNDSSAHSSISAGGRYVAFASQASNLVAGDTNGFQDVFVRDRVDGATTRVSVSGSGQQGDNYSLDPSISADGRYVAFESVATNLVPGDTNGRGDVFVRDRVSGTTTRVSVSSSGQQANDGDTQDRPSISADGRYVAFTTVASTLVSNDTNGSLDVFVRDRVSGTTTRVSVSSSGQQGDDHSLDPSISADGRYVAFTSQASNLVPGDTNRVVDVFVRDRVSGTTTRASVSSSGQQGNSGAYDPSISPDGRYVAFDSAANTLVPGDTNGWHQDVFVRDRGAPVASDGLFANLRGAAEVPGPGDPDGLGAVILHTRAALGRICGEFSLSKVGTPTAAHIHYGSFGTAGPIVVDLTPIVTGQQECVTGVSAATIHQIRIHPGQYYVNVHTADYPAGAVRGQLHI